MSSVNGQEYQHANLQVKIATQDGGAEFETVTFTDISYEDGAEKKPVMNSQGQIIGHTVGEQKTNGALTMLFSEWMRLKDLATQAAPTLGIGQIAFDFTCSYGDDILDLKVDHLRGVFFQKEARKSSKDQEAHTIEHELFIKEPDLHGGKFIKYDRRG